MKLELLKIKIEKESLLKIPSTERAFYLKAMNFLTDVSILQKSCWHSIPRKDSLGPLKESAAIIQAMFFVRHLAGLLLEGHELIKKGFLTKRLGENYKIKELKEITKYFSSKDNLIKKVRNKFAYHLDAEVVENEVETFPDNQELAVYLTKGVSEWSNNLYKAGDDILFSALARSANKGLFPMVNEILHMATTLQTFFTEFVIMCHEKYLGFKHKEKIVLDVPELSEVYIPYFVPRH